MAECLVQGVVPWEAILLVGAMSQTVLNEVREIVGGAQVPSVEIRPGWYF